MATKPADAATGGRSDARRNREALLRAACAVFAERGIDAPLDDIATRANVGNATLYRHFPTRCDLVLAVFTAHMRAYADAAKSAAADPDAWRGLRDYLTAMCRMQAQSRGFAELVTNTSITDATLVQLRSSARRDLIRLIRRAQRAGSLRADFTAQDAVLIMMANAGVIVRTAEHAPSSSARLISLLLDGLSTAAATDCPPAPPERHIVAAMRG